MSEHIKIRKATGTWVVRASGAVLAESTHALELLEGSYAPVIYFPREDVGMEFLDQTDSSTKCPHKGTATYYAIHGKNRVIPGAAWSYENPIKAVGEIKEHLAFAGEGVTVE